MRATTAVDSGHSGLLQKAQMVGGNRIFKEKHTEAPFLSDVGTNGGNAERRERVRIHRRQQLPREVPA